MPVKFQQGSCYFLKSSIIDEMIKIYIKEKEQIIKYVMQLCFVPKNIIPPDITIHNIILRAQGKIKYYDFFVPKNKNVIHLELTKNNDWETFAKILNMETGIHQI